VYCSVGYRVVMVIIVEITKKGMGELGREEGGGGGD